MKAAIIGRRNGSGCLITFDPAPYDMKHPTERAKQFLRDYTPEAALSGALALARACLRAEDYPQQKYWLDTATMVRTFAVVPLAKPADFDTTTERVAACG